MTGFVLPLNIAVRPILETLQKQLRSLTTLSCNLLKKPTLSLWQRFFHYHPEVSMDTVQHIEHHGYTVETYQVTTQDGYLLELYRIPHGKKDTQFTLTGGKRIPVLLQHGLLGSSAHWVFNLPENSLAFLLADAGFDVFLGNFRGNEHSRKHTTLDPNKSEFWQFSWDEMARYDMPAMIDRTLEITGHKQIYCIGHSLGALVTFCMLDTQPEYNEKIKAMFALAAVGNFEKLSNPLQNLAKYLTPVIDKVLIKTLGFHEFFFLRIIPKIVLGQITSYFRESIVRILFTSIGSDRVRWNSDRLPIFASHVAPTSYHVLLHLFQIMNTRQLQYYDWGQQTNLIKYGQSTPPSYSLSRVEVPVYLFYGANDKGTSKENVEFLKRKLSNVMGMHQAGDSNWNHLSYLTGVDAGEVFHNKLINMLKDVEENSHKMDIRQPSTHHI